MRFKKGKLLNEVGSTYLTELLILVIIATTLGMAILEPTYRAIGDNHTSVIEEIVELKGGGM